MGRDFATFLGFLATGLADPQLPEIMPPSDESREFYSVEAEKFQAAFADMLTAEEHEVLNNYTRFTGRPLADFYLSARKSLAQAAADALLSGIDAGDEKLLAFENCKEAIATYELMCELAPRGAGESYREVFPCKEAAEDFLKLERHALEIVLDMAGPIYDAMRRARTLAIFDCEGEEEYAPLQPALIGREKLLGFVDSYQARALEENWPSEPELLLAENP